MLGEGRQGPSSPTIDRIDNTRGYTKDNVLVVSHRANSIKSDATLDELEAIVSFYRHYQQKEADGSIQVGI